MKTTLLKDLLLQQGRIDRYFEGHVPTHLWRALNNKKAASLFELVEKPFMYPSGQPRPADITIVDRQGEKWVLVTDRPRGLSTFDAPGVPPGRDWSYYRIPAGTVLPAGLAIVRDEFNTRFGATHYTIAPMCDMSLTQFKLLLEQFAASAIKEVA
jgi:hypothetical protein